MNARTTANFYSTISRSHTCNPAALEIDAAQWLAYRLCVNTREANAILASPLGGQLATNWLAQPTEADQDEAFEDAFRPLARSMVQAANDLRMFGTLKLVDDETVAKLKRAFRR